MPLSPFHSRCPEAAKKEIRSLTVGSGSGEILDEYAFLEWYCDEPGCDCRKVMLQVLSRKHGGQVMASINFGWESEEFYRKRFPSTPNAGRELTQGSLDPFNPQSDQADELLRTFRETVATVAYRDRLKRHYELFRRTKPPKR